MTDYAIVLLPLEPEEGGGFVGMVPDLPGCIGDGETEQEALADTKTAIDSWIDTCRQMDRPVPGAGSAARKMRAREKALMDTLRAAVDLMDQQDGHIVKLERKIETMIRLMQEDSASRQFAGLRYIDRKALPKAH